MSPDREEPLRLIPLLINFFNERWESDTGSSDKMEQLKRKNENDEKCHGFFILIKNYGNRNLSFYNTPLEELLETSQSKRKTNVIQNLTSN